MAGAERTCSNRLWQDVPSVLMAPFIAPRSLRWRTRALVSTPWIPTTPWRSSHCWRSPSERQLLATGAS